MGNGRLNKGHCPLTLNSSRPRSACNSCNPPSTRSSTLSEYAMKLSPIPLAAIILAACGSWLSAVDTQIQNTGLSPGNRLLSNFWDADRIDVPSIGSFAGGSFNTNPLTLVFYKKPNSSLDIYRFFPVPGSSEHFYQFSTSIANRGTAIVSTKGVKFQIDEFPGWTKETIGLGPNTAVITKAVNYASDGALIDRLDVDQVKPAKSLDGASIYVEARTLTYSNDGRPYAWESRSRYTTQVVSFSQNSANSNYLTLKTTADSSSSVVGRFTAIVAARKYNTQNRLTQVAVIYADITK